LSKGPALNLDDLEVNGRDLIAMGLKPGPHFGDILDRLMERVLDDPEINTKERLLALLESEDPVPGVHE
jgi:hypothetical protein